jgi:hypothetical protein
MHWVPTSSGVSVAISSWPLLHSLTRSMNPAMLTLGRAEAMATTLKAALLVLPAAAAAADAVAAGDLAELLMDREIDLASIDLTCSSCCRILAQDCGREALIMRGFVGGWEGWYNGDIGILVACKCLTSCYLTSLIAPLPRAMTLRVLGTTIKGHGLVPRAGRGSECDARYSAAGVSC